ncbi:hypothetical protein BDQ17DRAFT_1217346, partial [Cyathus striatus]
QEFSRQIPTPEALSFSQRTNSLFIETSAKAAYNVKQAFEDVVTRILGTPELWAGESGKSRGEDTSSGRGGVPGEVQVVGLSEHE